MEQLEPKAQDPRRKRQKWRPQEAVEDFSTARLWVSPPTSAGIVVWGLGIDRRYRGTRDRRLLAHGQFSAPPAATRNDLICRSLAEALRSASGSLRV